MKIPKARTENLLEQNLKDETLIYDLTIDKAFNLNQSSTIVYKACNGITTFEDLKSKHKFSEDLIYLALDELRRNNLLADQKYVSPFASMNRRDVIKKVGLASMFVLPIITGLVAPKAINAASGGSDGSGGSSAAGNYDQVCLGASSSSGTIKYCNGELDCGYTSAGERCCVRQPGVSNYYYSGDSVSTPIDYGSPYYFPIDAAPTTDAGCGGSIIRCCNGQTPTGTCTYIRYQGEDGGDYDDPGPVLGLYFRSCNCICP